MKTHKTKHIQDQVILITGASSGIGLATATMAAKQGARVVMTARNAKELRKCVHKIRERGGDVLGIPGDISNIQDLETVRDRALETYGGIDTWVNNAGVAIYGELLNGDFDQEKKLFETNFWGTRMASHVAVQYFSNHSGTLINIGSELSELSPPVLGIYSASKHALRAFTDSLRIEVSEKNLPVNVCLIRPTSIATPMPEHGTSRLTQGWPSLPSLLYHPDVVATMIIRCAVNPKRDIFVGAQARLSSISTTLFPQMTDLVARLRSSAIRQGMPSPHQETQENLTHLSQEEGKIVGDYDRKILNRSLYSDLTTLGVGGTIRHYFSELRS